MKPAGSKRRTTMLQKKISMQQQLKSGSTQSLFENVFIFFLKKNLTSTFSSSSMGGQYTLLHLPSVPTHRPSGRHFLRVLPSWGTKPTEQRPLRSHGEQSINRENYGEKVVGTNNFEQSLQQSVNQDQPTRLLSSYQRPLHSHGGQSINPKFTGGESRWHE